MSESFESEVKSWLKCALENEQLDNLSCEIVGNSALGQGFLCDVLFVTATGQNKQAAEKKYNLVLKCNKNSKALMESSPLIRLSYQNEIYVYEKILPSFKQFQTDLGRQHIFDSVPKCYGVFCSEDKYVVVLENLKKAGYELWNLEQPLTRKHIDLVVSEYGKFHAISVAMREKKPEKFQELAEGWPNLTGSSFELHDLVKIHDTNVRNVYELVKDDLSATASQSWLNVLPQLYSFLIEFFTDPNYLRVVTHGDCWNNNFMYKYEDENKIAPSKVSILDWQLSKVLSPIADLSYFLFSCISPKDLDNLDNVLKIYYDSFIASLDLMGCKNYETKYSFENLLRDWKKYGKYGALLCIQPLKNGFIAEENIPDLSENASKGKDFTENFNCTISNEFGYKMRITPIVKYVVEYGLV